MSAATIPHEQMDAYQQRVEDVLAALGTDVRRDGGGEIDGTLGLEFERTLTAIDDTGCFGCE